MKPDDEVKQQGIENESFEQYRQRVHAGDKKAVQPHKLIRAFFGVFMIILYVGMGVLLLVNAFNWSNDWAWCRYVVGVVLIIYGIFRGYRQYRGNDYYSN